MLACASTIAETWNDVGRPVGNYIGVVYEKEETWWDEWRDE